MLRPSIQILAVMAVLLATFGLVRAAEPAAPAFPNVPDIPVPAGMGYGDYFKNHNPVRIVFGVSDAGSGLKESLTNAAYTIKYLAPRKIPYKIQIVLYGKAVRAASEFSNEYAGYGPLMHALHTKGVEFRVCNNSLAGAGVPASDVYSYMKIIPAGILQLTKKQMQGYAYITNH